MYIRYGLTSAVATGIAIVGLTLPAPVLAQEAGLEEIVVTAQRRAENLQNVPVSVTAITAETIAERGIRDISQLESLTPGLTIGRSGSDPRPAMRGVRTEAVGVNADTTIGFFVDGIYQSRAQQAMASFVDVQRIEVQRGPQGTLYGRNTFGGNIAIVTHAPELGKMAYSASLLGGRYSRGRFDGMVNLPVGDTVAFRFAGAYEKQDGWVENDFNSNADLFDENLKFGRVAARWQPNDNFTSVLRVDYTKQSGNGASAFGYKQAGTYVDRASCQLLYNATFTQLNVRAGNLDNVSDCTRTVGVGGAPTQGPGTTQDLGIPLYAAGDGYRIDNDYQTVLDLKNTNISLDLQYDFDAFSIKSISGSADFKFNRTADSDFSASTIAIDQQFTTAKTFSQELQLLSRGDGALQYVVGYYYFKDKLRGFFLNQQLPRTIRSSALAAPLALAQNGNGTVNDERPETESTALYGQLTFKATDQLSLTAGARYTEDKKDYKFANANSVLPNALSTAGALPGIQQPDARLIDLNIAPLIPDSAFGTAGTSNCVGPAINAYNGGAILLGSGYRCGGAGNNILFGATYDGAKFKKTTLRAAADYRLADDKLLYASYSTGFRSGGFNSGQAIGSARTFLPEEVNAIEVGLKSRFFDNRFQLNAAGYFNKYKNLQEQRQIATGGTTISVIFNAARAEAKGLELEAEWLATPELTLGSTLAVMDAKYTLFPDAPLPFGTSILVADATVTAPTVVNGITVAAAGQRRVFAPGYTCSLSPGAVAATFGCDLTGKKVPFSPRYQGALYGSYDFRLAGGGVIRPLLVARFSDQFFGLATNAESERQASFVKADLKLSWEVNQNWSGQLFVDNLTDEDTITRMVWGAQRLQVSYAPPRTYGLRVTYKN